MKPTEEKAASAVDALDHDRNGAKGGAAAAPDFQHLVVVKDSKSRGLVSGEVIAVTPADAKDLLRNDGCRNATHQEVELAQPRIRVWTA